MRNNQWSEIQEIAKVVLSRFKVKDLKNNDAIWILSDTATDMDKEIIRVCHDGYLPDNFRYEFIRECLLAIVENDSHEEAYESIDSDHRTYHLIEWMSSGGARFCYVNESVSEFGVGMKDSEFDIMKLIQRGQLKEKLEVMDLLVNAIQERI